MSDKSYYLSLRELFLLLSQSGMDSFFGFSDVNATQASETELFYSLHRMTQKGMLRVRDEALCPEEGLQQIIRTICGSFRCVTVRFCDPCRLPVCFYIADDAVVRAELSETAEKKTVRLNYLSKEDYAQTFCELLAQEGGPEDRVESAEAEWTPTAVYLAQKGLRLPSPEAAAMDAVVWTAEFFDVAGQKLTFRCCLVDESLQKTLLRILPDDVQIAVYSASEISLLAEQGGKRHA